MFRTLSDQHAKLPNNFVWMSDATANSEAMCYPVQTNLHGYIFGGYSIAEAYNIAWINAARFAYKFYFKLIFYLFNFL